MKIYPKYPPLLVLSFVLVLCLLPQYSTQSQSARTAARGAPAAAYSQTDENSLPVKQSALSLENQTVYLPLVINSTTVPSVGIYGKVTVLGEPVEGVVLALMHNAVFPREPITTTTRSDGIYSFSNIPSLDVDEDYYVRYINEQNPNYLWRYTTPSLESYTTGSDIFLSDFDIGEIELVSPTDGKSVLTPITFVWKPRVNMSTDSYQWVINNKYFDHVYSSLELGYTSDYRLEDLSEAPMVAGSKYYWEVWVYRPDFGHGISFDTHVLYFAD
jgi:hypothetical protein